MRRKWLLAASDSGHEQNSQARAGPKQIGAQIDVRAAS
jgi:hypothetical protein